MPVTVTNNADAERYEITVDGELAGVAEYRGGGAVRAFTHTEIAEGFGGQGLATKLIAAALDDVRSQGGVQVLPLCPFVKAFLNDHREYLDLVSPNQRAAMNLPDPE